MKEEKNRFMQWKPGASGFSHDELILAVGFQSSKKQFPVKDVIEWLGSPHRILGNAKGGEMAYLYSDAKADVFPMFQIANGKVVQFAVMGRFINNARRKDPKTGEEIHFNILDEMKPFKEEAFK